MTKYEVDPFGISKGRLVEKNCIELTQVHAFRFFSQYELAGIYFPTSLGSCELYVRFPILPAYTTMAIRSLICSYHLRVLNNCSLAMWLTDLT